MEASTEVLATWSRQADVMCQGLFALEVDAEVLAQLQIVKD